MDRRLCPRRATAKLSKPEQPCKKGSAGLTADRAGETDDGLTDGRRSMKRTIGHFGMEPIEYGRSQHIQQLPACCLREEVEATKRNPKISNWKRIGSNRAIFDYRSPLPFPLHRTFDQSRLVHSLPHLARLNVQLLYTYASSRNGSEIRRQYSNRRRPAQSFGRLHGGCEVWVGWGWSSRPLQTCLDLSGDDELSMCYQVLRRSWR